MGKTNSVTRFKGLASWLNLAEQRPDRATDLMNVIVGSSGALEKMRLPTLAAAAPGGITSGPGRLLCYPGYSKIFAQYAAELRSGTVNTDGTITLGGVNPTYPTVAAALSSVEMNGQFFFANGTDMFTGGAKPWGIAAPAAPSIPKAGDGIGNNQTLSSMTRNGALSRVFAGTASPLYVKVGDKITVAGCSDLSFNGTFVLTAVDATKTAFEWTQVGAGATPGTSGTISAASYAIEFSVSSAIRTGGFTTVTLTVAPPTALSNGAWITVAGMTDASFNGIFKVFSVGGNDVSYFQAGLPNASSGAGTVGTPFSITVLISYKLAAQQGATYYTNASSVCQLVNQDGTPVTGTNRMVVLKMPAPSVGLDAGSDFWVPFRTLDGGGDFYATGLLSVVGVAGDPSKSDSNQDPPGSPTDIDTQTRAPLLNGVPPAGKYVAKYGGRIYITGLSGNSLDVAYSGYEQVLVGDPPRSFPPLNRLKLRFGAQPPRGIGVFQAGVVVFGVSGRMYMQRGVIEDISVTTPVVFSAYVEELPWEIGLSSHASIVTSAYGLVWVAGDKTVRLFDGTSKPLDISGAAYPLLRSITAGQEQNIVGAYYTWLDRDWYVIACAVDGATSPNRIVCFDLTPSAELNAGIFVSSIQADAVSVAEDTNGQRRLYISQGGAIKVLDMGSQLTGGLNLAPTSTTGQLAAWWQGGFAGNEDDLVTKYWRDFTLDTQPGVEEFGMEFNLVDSQENTFDDPELVPVQGPDFGTFKVGRKALACQPKIVFPVKDRSASVLAMTSYFVPVGVK